MPTFTYSARTKAGEKVGGTLDASDRRAALGMIEARGQVPVTVIEKAAAAAAGAKPDSKAARGKLTVRRGPVRMNGREVLVFTAELSDLLASGMTLGNALNTLGNRRSGRPSDAIIQGLRDEIIHGASLSDALGRHPQSFSTLFVHMIRAGEASGALSEVLKRLVEHYERVQETKEKVIAALVYPVIVLVMGVATMVFCMIYVVPKFKMVFAQMDAALPLPTRMLIGLSAWTVRYGWAAVVVIGILAVLFGRALKTTRGRRAWDKLLLRVPLLRGVVASGIYANFARTLATLLANGVAVLQALGIVEKTVGNTVIGEEIRKARERVTDGTTISGPLSAGKVFPEMLTDMMAIGEQTGDMPAALNHIARRYENELNRHIKIFTTALEPILIVLVAVMVGFVAISILMAVFSLTNALNL